MEVNNNDLPLVGFPAGVENIVIKKASRRPATDDDPLFSSLFPTPKRLPKKTFVKKSVDIYEMDQPKSNTSAITHIKRKKDTKEPPSPEKHPPQKTHGYTKEEIQTFMKIKKKAYHENNDMINVPLSCTPVNDFLAKKSFFVGEDVLSFMENKKQEKIKLEKKAKLMEKQKKQELENKLQCLADYCKTQRHQKTFKPREQSKLQEKSPDNKILNIEERKPLKENWDHKPSSTPIIPTNKLDENLSELSGEKNKLDKPLPEQKHLKSFSIPQNISVEKRDSVLRLYKVLETSLGVMKNYENMTGAGEPEKILSQIKETQNILCTICSHPNSLTFPTNEIKQENDIECSKSETFSPHDKTPSDSLESYENQNKTSSVHEKIISSGNKTPDCLHTLSSVEPIGLLSPLEEANVEHQNFLSNLYATPNILQKPYSLTDNPNASVNEPDITYEDEYIKSKISTSPNESPSDPKKDFSTLKNNMISAGDHEKIGSHLNETRNIIRTLSSESIYMISTGDEIKQENNIDCSKSEKFPSHDEPPSDSLENSENLNVTRSGHEKFLSPGKENPNILHTLSSEPINLVSHIDELKIEYLERVKRKISTPRTKSYPNSEKSYAHNTTSLGKHQKFLSTLDATPNILQKPSSASHILNSPLDEIKLKYEPENIKSKTSAYPNESLSDPKEITLKKNVTSAEDHEKFRSHLNETTNMIRTFPSEPVNLVSPVDEIEEENIMITSASPNERLQDKRITSNKAVDDRTLFITPTGPIDKLSFDRKTVYNDTIDKEPLMCEPIFTHNLNENGVVSSSKPVPLRKDSSQNEIQNFITQWSEKPDRYLQNDVENKMEAVPFQNSLETSPSHILPIGTPLMEEIPLDEETAESDRFFSSRVQSRIFEKNEGLINTEILMKEVSQDPTINMKPETRNFNSEFFEISEYTLDKLEMSEKQHCIPSRIDTKTLSKK